jgi:hypothetical protein
MSVDADKIFTDTARWLFEAYGGILDSPATAKALGFKSTSALQQARRAGRLPIPMFQIPGRRGWYAHARKVGAWLDADDISGRRVTYTEDDMKT